jgi:aspartate carbamoyltransferase catalytic subunit
MGAKVTLISSPTLLPIGVQNWPVEIKYDLDEDLNKFDVVMLLRIQMERMSDAFFPSEREYSRYFGFNSDRFTKLKASAIVMHPGPMNRGLEISSAAADSGQSKVLDQVKNGVISRMAVLYQLLANPVGGNN